MISFSAEDEQLIDLTPPEILNAAQNANESLIPAKSKEKYLVAYDSFLQWKSNKKTQSFSENVFLAYFSELANTYKPNSLWYIYSMLRSMVKLKHGVDIKTYCNLMAFLKRRSDGYIGRKSKVSKVLSPADVEKFLNEAPDNQYLATKVALIFGVTGACRRHELYNITTKDVETHGDMLLVKITQTKTKIPRFFTIQGTFHKIVKKYQDLRSTKSKNDRFFQNFQKGKCTAQTIGINKLGNMPREIARYLGLPEANFYTGHSFRRTSATMLADSGADRLTLKRHGGWRSDAVAESYIEDSIHNKAKISDKITQAISLESKAENFCPEEPQPVVCTSRSMSYLVPSPPSNFYDLPFSPTFTQEVNEGTKEVASTNVTQTVKLPSKTLQYHFENCTFTNCFNN